MLVYLLVQSDFPVEMLSSKCLEVLDLLVVVRLELGHSRVQHRFTTCGNLLVLLNATVNLLDQSSRVHG